MNNAILVQNCNTNGDYYRFHKLTYGNHVSYCKRHNFDYWCSLSDVVEGGTGSTSKMHIVKQLIDKYEYVVWLDSDCLIVNDSTDLREAFKDRTISIGAVEYDEPVLHLNAGAFYIKVNDDSKRLFNEWFNTPMIYPWYEQAVLNDLANKHPDIIGAIDYKFNDWWGKIKSPEPVVVGFHGSNDIDFKITCMTNALLCNVKVDKYVS